MTAGFHVWQCEALALCLPFTLLSQFMRRLGAAGEAQLGLFVESLPFTLLFFFSEMISFCTQGSLVLSM